MQRSAALVSDLVDDGRQMALFVSWLSMRQVIDTDHCSSVSERPCTELSAEPCHPSQRYRVSRQRLWSAQQNTLVVPRYGLTTYGRRAFSVAGPTVWNSLPVAFRDPTISDACFRRHLKTVLFAQQRRHHSV